ncbi:MAG: GIY-YIG nuclease family protein, partial [Deltaproteobacteria bacterium]|nr:GIY-YIG nuclease family protein [Deltaproteobacteria bacterium]
MAVIPAKAGIQFGVWRYGQAVLRYILASKRNGTLYIGVTSQLATRVWQHKSKVVEGFSAKYGVDKLVY